MGSMNISIKDEAYRFLASLKKNSESFSDVILRFKTHEENKDKILAFFGILSGKDIDWKEKEERMKSFRDSFSNRLVDVRNRMATTK